MVALIVAAERSFTPRVRTTDPDRRVEMSWNAATRTADGPDGGADVLCLGDSLLKLGILPRILEDRLGRSVYNLGVLGGQAPGSYFLLRRVLERGLRPQAILVDFAEDLLSLAPGLSPVCWADSLGRRESLEVAWHSRDPALAISTGMHWLLPNWCDQNHRQQLCILGSANVFRNFAADDPRVFERNWKFNRGAQVAPREFVPVERVSARDDERWQPHPANALYVDKLLRTAKAHRIPVFWILTPLESRRRRKLEQHGVSAAYRDFVDRRLAGFSCLTVLDGHDLLARIDEFRDPIHVNRDGAIRLSLAVARATRPRLCGEFSGSRWIVLAGEGDQEISKYQSLVEDLDQSRAAVEPIVVGQSSREADSW